jgi:RNA polymerase sigma-70 factor (ECF subfamily)
MSAGDLPDRLSRIQTRWSKLLASVRSARSEQQRQLLRYHEAAFHYLLAMVRDPAVAEELSQDFAVRFLRGDFRQVDPQRGRFRDFLKAALRNLARDYWRKLKKKRDQPEAASEDDFADFDEPADDPLFRVASREDLFARTWEALARFEERTGKPYFAVLRLKTQQPSIRSPELAQRLGQELNRDFSPEALRQTLHRARKQFAELLLDEVRRSLADKNLDRLEEELIELQLLDYCRSALEERRSTFGNS